MRYIQILSNSGEVQTALDSQELGKPYVVYLEDENRLDWNSKSLTPPLSAQPLTFEIISAGTVEFAKASFVPDRDLKYKVNNGEWVSHPLVTGDRTCSVNVVAGDIVEFKGRNIATNFMKDIMTSGSTALFNVYGNLMSLINDGDFDSAVSATTFEKLFQNNVGIIDASNLVLPALPNVSSTTFYQSLFENCTNLVSAPNLLDGTLPAFSYSWMFSGCRKLSYLKCIATDISAQNCTVDWLKNVSTTGTFVKHPDAIWTSGTSGIPSGWTVIDADI